MMSNPYGPNAGSAVYEFLNSISGLDPSSSAPSSPAADDLWYDKSNDLLKRYDGSDWQTAGDGTYGVRDAGGFTPVSGRYQVPPGSGSTTVAMLADRVYVVPFTISRDATLDRVGMAVTSAGDGSAVIRLAVAEWNDGNPSLAPLVSTLGTIDGTSATSQEITSINLDLARGSYWMVVLTNGETSTAPSVRAYVPACSVPSVNLAGALEWSPGTVVSSATETGSISDPLPNVLTAVSPAPKVVFRFV